MGLGAGACFASPVGGEVLVAGRKVIGSAQRREGAAFLQHGSILLDGSQAVLRAVGRPPDGPVEPDAATTLRAVLERPVDFSEVAEAICATWGLGCDLACAVQSDASHTARFADSAWTWRR
jgi:lipoate-protein ligase A